MRALYLDTSFENESGGDKNRSRFLWQQLSQQASLDFVLLSERQDSGERIDIEPVAAYTPRRPGALRPAAIPGFSRADKERFAQLVERGGYDVIIARFCTAYELLAAAAERCPRVAIVVDVDMLESRLAQLSWEVDPSFSRRWFFLQQLKLRAFERSLFRKPWTFLFTNGKERELAESSIPARDRRGHFWLVPNPMPTLTRSTAEPKSVVLFFGSLNSQANCDGVSYLLDDVFPLIAADLESAGCELWIVGKDPFPPLVERAERLGSLVSFKGRVESMAEAIAQSMFVLLPLRIASGTRTRILEAACQKRPVVTTSIGVEGLELADGVLVGDSATVIAGHVKSLLRDEERRRALGEALFQSARQRYAEEQVGAALLSSVESAIAHQVRA